MLTALFGLISGLVSGVLPDVLKELRESRDHAREREFIVLSHDLQMQRVANEAGAKLDLSVAELEAEQWKLTEQRLMSVVQAGSKITGIKWIDALNASLRPVIAFGIAALFMWTAISFVGGAIQMFNQQVSQAVSLQDFLTALDTLSRVIWGSIVGEGIMAMFGFVFGYRSVDQKRRKQAARA